MNAETILTNLTDVYDDFRQRSQTYSRLASLISDETDAKFNEGQSVAFSKAAARIKSFIHAMANSRVENKPLSSGAISTCVTRQSTAN